MVDHMIQMSYLDSEGGLVRIGPETEREFGRGHYRDLLASFSGAQLLTGRCGGAGSVTSTRLC
jgi:ATP-dependent Lhr-like helicase